MAEKKNRYIIRNEGDLDFKRGFVDIFCTEGQLAVISNQGMEILKIERAHPEDK